MRDSVSGVKGMSPHRPLKNGHFCCRTCLSSCKMCNLGWLHSPPTWPLLDVKREVFPLSLMFHLLKMRFILICARPLRVRVLCACASSVSIWPLSLAAEVLRNSFEREKKNQKQINLQFVAGGGWADRSVRRVRTSSCSLGSVIHPIKSCIPRFQHPKRDLAAVVAALIQWSASFQTVRLHIKC